MNFSENDLSVLPTPQVLGRDWQMVQILCFLCNLYFILKCGAALDYELREQIYYYLPLRQKDDCIIRPNIFNMLHSTRVIPSPVITYTLQLPKYNDTRGYLNLFSLTLKQSVLHETNKKSQCLLWCRCKQGIFLLVGDGILSRY